MKEAILAFKDRWDLAESQDLEEKRVTPDLWVSQEMTDQLEILDHLEFLVLKVRAQFSFILHFSSLII